MNCKMLKIRLSENVEQYYEASVNVKDGKKLLIITPDLSLNGANVVLLQMIMLLKKYFAYVCVLSTEDGLFRDKLHSIDIDVCINSSVLGSHEMTVLLQNEFDMVFLNTSSVHYYALYFQNKDVPVWWWFHESYEQLSITRENFIHLALLSDNFRFFGVTDKVIRGLVELYGVKAEILPMAVVENEYYEKPTTWSMSDPIRFFIPAAYTYIKGQDVLLQAISMLPEEYLNRTEFVFAGYHLPKQEEYYNKICKVGTVIPQVHFLDALSQKEVYEYYKKSHCVIAPSRVDSTPTTIVEAMMFRKLCIVSTGAGISEYLHDCVDAFVVPSENVEELMKRLLLVIINYDSLQKVAEAGRKIYEQLFSVESVGELLDEFMNY